MIGTSKEVFVVDAYMVDEISLENFCFSNSADILRIYDVSLRDFISGLCLGSTVRQMLIKCLASSEIL